MTTLKADSSQHRLYARRDESVFNSSHSMSLKISKLCLLVMSDEFIQKTFSFIFFDLILISVYLRLCYSCFSLKKLNQDVFAY